MKIKFSIAIVFAFAFNISKAQDELKEVKNDIGFNTSIIINGILNTGTTLFNFMYKRQTAQTRALRYGLALNGNFNSQSGNNPNYNINNTFNISPRIGKEWQFTAGKKWLWYCGADIRFSILNIASETYTNNLPVSNLRATRYGIALSPFLGLRFIVSQRLYLATEGNLNIGYFSSKNKNITYDNSGAPILTQDYTVNSVMVNAGSAVGIFVFYRF